MNGLASPSQLRMSFLRYALVTVPLVLLLGLLSGQLANSGYGNAWFDALEKPDFMPPGWVFGAAWTVLYIFNGLSLALILHARGARNRTRAIVLFVLQLLLNYSWSPVFFALHDMEMALRIVAAMVVITAVLIAIAWRIRPLAGALLLPYLGWLIFATALTWSIIGLNPDAAGLVPAASGTDIAL